MRRRRRRIAHKVVLGVLIVLLAGMIWGRMSGSGEMMSIFGYKLAVDLTESMKPELEVNDLVVVKECEEGEIGVGDIIAFREGEAVVTHRVVGVEEGDDGGKEFMTKGDNNNIEDEEGVRFEQVEGKYVFKVPWVGWLLMNRVVLVVILGVLVVVLMVPGRGGRRKKVEEEKEGGEVDF